MKRVLVSAGLLVLFALDGLALHDIMTGEANVRAEWLFLVVSLICAAGVLFSIRGKNV